MLVFHRSQNAKEKKNKTKQQQKKTTKQTNKQTNKQTKTNKTNKQKQTNKTDRLSKCVIHLENRINAIFEWLDSILTGLNKVFGNLFLLC